LSPDAEERFSRRLSHINRNFTHNLAINYTETLLRENDFILTRAATSLPAMTN
jgi:hypothetical protein